MRIQSLADDAQSVRLRPFATGVQSLAFQQHAAILAMGSVERHDSATLSVWDMALRDTVRAVDVGESVPALSFHTGADLLAYVNGEGHAALLRYRTQAPQERIGSHTERYTCLTFLHGSTVLALGTVEGAVEFWDAGNHTLIHRHHPHKAAVYMITCSQNGRRLASASRDNTAILWES